MTSDNRNELARILRQRRATSAHILDGYIRMLPEKRLLRTDAEFFQRGQSMLECAD